MSTGTKLVYNGISLSFCRISNFKQEAIYTDDGIDKIYTKCTIEVEGVLNKSIPGSQAAYSTQQSPQQELAFMRELILEPRKGLLLEMEGVPVINLSSVGNSGITDEKKGPYPRFFNVLKVSPYTLIVGFCIECYLPCPDPKHQGLLTHRYSTIETIDEKYYTTRTIQGFIVVAGSAGGNEPDADIYRNAILVIPKTPPGWKRQNIAITVQSDGLRLNYTIVDKELYLSFPAGAVEVEASYSQSWGMAQAIMNNEINVIVVGKKEIPKWRLLQIAVGVVKSRVHLVENSADISKPMEWLTGCTMREDLMSNKIEIHVTTNRAPPDKLEDGSMPILTTDIGGNVGQEANNTQFKMGGPAVVPTNKDGVPTTRPGKLGVLIACMMSDRCSLQGKNFITATPSSPTSKSPGDTAITIQEAQTINDYQNRYSNEQTASPYTTYKFKSVVKTSVNGLALPVATSSTNSVTFIEVAKPSSVLVVDWTVERFGDKPKLPQPIINNPDIVLLNWDVEVDSLETNPGGNVKKYSVAGKYVYGTRKPFATSEVLLLPVSPIFNFTFASTEALIEPQNWVTGMIDSGGSQNQPRV